MNVNIDMPSVRECEVAECGYNRNSSCHAKAITVGDGAHPACDTFFPSNRHTQISETAGVGACKVEVCAHNKDFECQAPSIAVGHHNGHADCVTFTRRK